MRLVLPRTPGRREGHAGQVAVRALRASRRSRPATSSATTCSARRRLGDPSALVHGPRRVRARRPVVEMVMERLDRARRARGLHPRRVPAHGAAGRGARARARPRRTSPLTGGAEVHDLRRESPSGGSSAAARLSELQADATTWSSSRRRATALRRRAARRSSDARTTTRRRSETARVYQRETEPLERTSASGGCCARSTPRRPTR